MRDRPRPPNPGETPDQPQSSQDVSSRSTPADATHHPPRRSGTVDPDELRALLDYRDERARLERTRRGQQGGDAAPKDPGTTAAGDSTRTSAPIREPERRPGVARPVDPDDLQSLIDYRDQRARLEREQYRQRDPSAGRTPNPTDESRRRPASDGLRTPGPRREVDPDELRALLDYRDERARLERAGLLRARIEARPEAADSESTVRESTGDPVRRTGPDHEPVLEERPDSTQADSDGDEVATRAVVDRVRDLRPNISSDVVATLGFDPGHDRGALGEHFRPGLLDPHGEIAGKAVAVPKIAEKELRILQYLVHERGALVTVLPEDPTPGTPNPDAIVRWNSADEGGTLEYKTLRSPEPGAIDQNLRRGSKQLADRPDPQLLIDGRDVNTTRSDAVEAWANRVRISPSTARTVHFILGDGQWLTLPNERERRGT